MSVKRRQLLLAGSGAGLDAAAAWSGVVGLRRVASAAGSAGVTGLATSAGLASPALLQGCAPAPSGPSELQGGWVGAAVERGHQLRRAKSGALPAPTRTRRAQVVVVGGGVAGLAAARAFGLRGVQDVQLLELEDQAGGNARAHHIAGMACPLGAHYLPLPPATAHEVHALLFELGLLKNVAGRTVPDERHLCHSPQERLFFDGAWHEGLLPPHEDNAATLAAYRQFAAALRVLQKQAAGNQAQPGFTLPSHRAAWGAVQQTLDGLTFAQWLDAQGLTETRLRWYLDYCCRDDYGAGSDGVSAWAGVHYFASRHGFHAPGQAEGERDAVFTWPEGNAWLTAAMARPLGERLHTGQVVLQVQEQRHAVEVLALDTASQELQTWVAQTVVLAVPLFVAAHLLPTPPPALQAAAAQLRYAPWLVANLHLHKPLLDRSGAPPSWDNVVYGARGLGYVDAMHQSLRPHAGATVLTAYQALPVAARGELLNQPWQHWAQQVLLDLQGTHPDLGRAVARVDLVRHGHAMAIPAPGVRTSSATAALWALRQQKGRVRFAHADLAGYSVFEEAFTAGFEAAG